MKINKKQMKVEYGDDRIYYMTSQIISSIETLFNDYDNLPISEKYNLLSVFYTFDMEDGEKYDVYELVKEFERTHSKIDIYNDVKSNLAILVYDINRNATNDYEEELSLQLKYYYNTTFKQKQRSLE